MGLFLACLAALASIPGRVFPAPTKQVSTRHAQTSNVYTLWAVKMCSTMQGTSTNSQHEQKSNCLRGEGSWQLHNTNERKKKKKMFLVSTDGLDYIKTPVIVRCRSQHLKILHHISVASKLQSSWGANKKLLPLANATCEKFN